MNERIRELAKEAGFEIDNGPLLPGLTTITMKVGGLYVGVPVEKFAKLIVQECIEIANLSNTHGNNLWDKALTFAVNTIKENFGVEE